MHETKSPRTGSEGLGRRGESAFIPRPEVAARLQEALGVLEAINQGELFAGVPGDPHDRARHEAGLATLAVLTRELERLLADVRTYEEITAFSPIERTAMGIKP